jgi:hypothetical protein
MEGPVSNPALDRTEQLWEGVMFFLFSHMKGPLFGPPWIEWNNIDMGLYLSSLPHGGPCLWFSTWTAWALSLVPALDRMEYILLRGPIL